jgi:tetratricopeptide (TPR) repeat protein
MWAARSRRHVAHRRSVEDAHPTHHPGGVGSRGPRLGGAPLEPADGDDHAPAADLPPDVAAGSPDRLPASLGPAFASPPPGLSFTGDALWLFRAGRYREAIPLVEDEVREREGALGPTHPAVAQSLNDLAELYRLQGRYIEAEPPQQRALAIREQRLGATHPAVAFSLNSLAKLYHAQGRYAEAESLFRRALAIQNETLGPTHPGVAHSVNGLAELYRAQGRYAEAEPLFRRALTMREQTLGPSHPRLAFSLANLATVLAGQGQRARARPLFERARQIYLAVSRADGDLSEEAYHGWLWQAMGSLRSYVALLATMASEPERESSPPATALAAFVVAEQARGGAVELALARAGVRAAATNPATAMLARQVQDLRQHQRAVWQQLNDTYGSPGEQWDASRLVSLRQTLQQADGELAAATTRLQQAFPRYAELATPVPIEVPAVQTLLHRDEALISFFTLPDRLLVWLVQPHRRPVYRDVPIAKATLTAMVARVRRTLEQGPWQPFDVAQAHALYTLLLAPLWESLAGVTHLFLVPDDVLRPVPFGALVTEARGTSYQRLANLVTQPRRPTTTDLAAYTRLAWLANDYALTMLPSATTLRTLRQLPAHTRFRAPQNVRHRHQGQPRVIAQQEHSPLLRPQPVQPLPHPLLQHLRTLLRRPWRGAMGAARDFLPLVLLQTSPPAAVAQRLEALLAGDGHKPGADRGRLPEPRHGGVGPEEDLLRHLLPQPGIPEHRDTVADDQVLVTSDEGLQNRTIVSPHDQALDLVITDLEGVLFHHLSPRIYSFPEVAPSVLLHPTRSVHRAPLSNSLTLSQRADG